MSLYYTHLLIPLSPECRPEPTTIAAFAQELINKGNIGTPFTISFSRVAKREPFFREIRNVATGETIKMRLPSRKEEDQPQTLANALQIIECASSEREYDIAIASQGTQLVPPCAVGYVENDLWKPMTSGYHMEVRCRVRDRVVRLSMIAGDEDLKGPPDFSKWRPTFVHPECEGIRIPNAGCGTFWIEFRYGKFLFPLLENGSVDLLDVSILRLARETFGEDFVQACNWG